MSKNETLLIKFLAKNPASTGSMIASELRGHVAPNMVHPLLKRMKEQGLIHRKGNSSAARWYAGPDENVNRNDVIMRLRSIASDIRKTSIHMNEICEAKAQLLRREAILLDAMVKLETSHE